MTARRVQPGTIIFSAVVACLVSWWWLGLELSGLWPRADALQLTSDVFVAAAAPDPESIGGVLRALLRTFAYAVGAASLAIPVGLVLGVLAVSGRSRTTRRFARVSSAIMRSTHELLWAVLLLAAFGLTPLGAVVALAIPHAGTLGKVFAELLEETPRNVAEQLRGSGTGAVSSFVFGVLPRARGNICAYTFYRFECMLRGAAVLGFFGVDTVGLLIREAFGDGDYGLMWTSLYALLGAVIALEVWSAAVRVRLGQPRRRSATRVRRDWVVRGSVVVAVAAVAMVWTTGPFGAFDVGPQGVSFPSKALEETFGPARLGNVGRFLERLVHGSDSSWGARSERLGEALLHGLLACATTLAVAVCALSIASVVALGFVFPASGGRGVWVATPVRLVLTALRAMPEYILAFVFAVLGPGAWPAVLALAVHNVGILGRLGAEVVDDLDHGPGRQARAAGASRAQIAWCVALPQATPRWLVFVFYRLESCIRESVVLGMLGVGTLGYLIQNDARAKLRYDEMLLYLALGLILVLGGDRVSRAVRRRAE